MPSWKSIDISLRGTARGHVSGGIGSSIIDLFNTAYTSEKVYAYSKADTCGLVVGRIRNIAANNAAYLEHLTCYSFIMVVATIYL